MCELAKHIYKQRDVLLKAKEHATTNDALAQIKWIDKLMSYHYEECSDCKAFMDVRRAERTEETKEDAKREWIMKNYGIAYCQAKNFTEQYMEQVLRCKSPEARRLLLGVSE